MREYGAMKATEFSKKQIGVIYFKAKNGELKVEKWLMSKLYDLADYYGYDDNRSVTLKEPYVLKILESIFANNLEKAQEVINDITEDWFKYTSRKYSDKFDRSLVA